MKKLFDDEIELITPCFCAGADQAVAEIRAPSIRGELRWWFRTLGGSKQDEQTVFGGISGEEGAASSVVVRVSNVRPATPAKLADKANMNNPSDPFYLLYFAHASGDGVRYEKGGHLAPETRFRLQILLRRGETTPLLLQAIECFLRFGALGYRSNRACGALCVPDQLETFDSFYEAVKKLPADIQVAWLQHQTKPKFSSNWYSAFEAESKLLKSMRKAGYSAGKSGNEPSPFGRSLPRQGSAVRLRPVHLQEGILPAVVYVPAILGAACADAAFSLADIKVGNELLGRVDERTA